MAKEKQKRINKKTGAVDPGKGKVRPHHKAARQKAIHDSKGGYHEQTQSKLGKDTLEHRVDWNENNYVPRTPNKYQSNFKKVNEGKHEVTYEWFEDNGHKDHLQYKRKTVIKEGSEPIVMCTITTEEYQKNYKEIFGERERGVNVDGGYKKFKKTYK